LHDLLVGRRLEDCLRWRQGEAGLAWQRAMA
jgi:hypothetical protein